MIDDIDHAEHAAVAAEQAAEREAEAAHEQQRRDLITALFGLSADSVERAARSLTQITDSLAHRAFPGASYLFAQRAQAVAHLAARAAGTLEDYNGYDLRGQVEALAAAQVAHNDGPTADKLRRFAVGRVRVLLDEQLGPRP